MIQDQLEVELKKHSYFTNLELNPKILYLPITHSVYRSSTIATMMTMRETEKIWQPEPMSEENISGWLDGRNTSP